MSTGRSPTVNRVLPATSRAANDGKLWIVVAGLLAVAGGRRGRRAAVDGLVAVGVTSVVNGAAKRVIGRPRPGGLPALGIRRVGRVPRTSSFPSGHTASGAAFAVAAGIQAPFAVPGLIVAAGAVGWSRMHAGRHFPSDVMAGVVVGATVGLVVHAAGQRFGERSQGADSEPSETDGKVSSDRDSPGADRTRRRSMYGKVLLRRSGRRALRGAAGGVQPRPAGRSIP
ncbi:MAG: phosphatase PAP2 family protein [Acidimicrobiia bacterium]|nr:phosphatase PAP2 family protein [Acidimicrobiia bacterium]